MNWDYIFPTLACITAVWILWTIGQFIQEVLGRPIGVIEEEEDTDITEWQQKLQEMHRRAQKAESQVAKLEKRKAIQPNSFWHALATVSASDNKVAHQSDYILVMKKIDGVVRISSGNSGLAAHYIAPQWLTMKWTVKDVHNQA